MDYVLQVCGIAKEISKQYTNCFLKSCQAQCPTKQKCRSASIQFERPLIDKWSTSSKFMAKLCTYFWDRRQRLDDINIIRKIYKEENIKIKHIHSYRNKKINITIIVCHDDLHIHLSSTEPKFFLTIVRVWNQENRISHKNSIVNRKCHNKVKGMKFLIRKTMMRLNNRFIGVVVCHEWHLDMNTDTYN